MNLFSDSRSYHATSCIMPPVSPKLHSAREPTNGAIVLTYRALTTIRVFGMAAVPKQLRVAKMEKVEDGSFFGRIVIKISLPSVPRNEGPELVRMHCALRAGVSINTPKDTSH